MKDKARPHILFIATKDRDYSRLKILQASLEEDFELDCIYSPAPGYARRIIYAIKEFFKRIGKRYDVLFIGFFAQTVFPVIRPFWFGKVISDCYISLYDSLIFDRQMYKPGSMMARFSYVLDWLLLRFSHLSLTDTPAHVNYLSKTYTISPERILDIPIGADERFFPDLSGQPLAYDQEQPFCVLFFGGFIPLQGVDVILRAAALLKDELIEFTLIGEGQTYDDCRAMADELALKHVAFLGWQKIDKLAAYAGEHHVILGIFGETEKTQRVIPNKAYEALSLGKPLITADTPAIRCLLQDGRDALLCTCASPEALADRIRWSRSNYTESLAIAKRGRQTFVEHASVKVIRERLVRGVNAVLGS